MKILLFAMLIGQLSAAPLVALKDENGSILLYKWASVFYINASSVTTNVEVLKKPAGVEDFEDGRVRQQTEAGLIGFMIYIERTRSEAKIHNVKLDRAFDKATTRLVKSLDWEKFLKYANAFGPDSMKAYFQNYDIREFDQDLIEFKKKYSS